MNYVIKNNKWCKPISGMDDFRIEYFKFITWLDTSQRLKTNGRLSDTYSALRHSTLHTEITSILIKYLQRGGLSVPRDMVKNVCHL